MSRAYRHKRHVTCGSSATELSLRQVMDPSPCTCYCYTRHEADRFPSRTALAAILVSEKYTCPPQKANHAKDFNWPTLNYTSRPKNHHGEDPESVSPRPWS